VSIGPGQPVCHVTGFRPQTPTESIRFSLAGQIAERIGGNIHATSSDGWLRNILANIRGGWNRDEANDDNAVLTAILDEEPLLTDDEVITRYRAHDAEVEKILSRPEMWSSVERVAEALLNEQCLDDGRVRELLEENVCCGALREFASQRQVSLIARRWCSARSTISGPANRSMRRR
jgi:hypothetical protein